MCTRQREKKGCFIGLRSIGLLAFGVGTGDHSGKGYAIPKIAASQDQAISSHKGVIETTLSGSLKKHR